MFEGDGAIVQYAYVVENLNQAIEHWTTDVGAGPFFVKAHLNDLDFKYRGKKSTLDMSFALGQAGAIQIELIEVHSDNPSIYTDMYPKGSGGGFHHVAMFSKDFDAAVRTYEQKGFEAAMQGIFGTTPFAYMDTRSALGFMVELYPPSQQLLDLYKMVADASIGWDRVEKTRPM